MNKIRSYCKRSVLLFFVPSIVFVVSLTKNNSIAEYKKQKFKKKRNCIYIYLFVKITIQTKQN